MTLPAGRTASRTSSWPPCTSPSRCSTAGGFSICTSTARVVLELVLLALIVRYAWTWPRTAPSATMETMATSPDRETVRAQQQA